MPVYLTGLTWLLLLLGPLLFLQRRLHRETQAIFLLLTHRAEIALALFSLLFFPGVLLHETSHYLMARLLWVRTGRISLLPRPLADGRLQLGFVETTATDWLRDALIGAAPLFAGGAFVAYAGLERLRLTLYWEQSVVGGPPAFMESIPRLYAQPDFWLWFYLIFAVSSTMLPSSSDRRTWLPLSVVVGLLLGASLLAGAGPWLLLHFAAPLDQILRTVAVVFGISVSVHLVLLFPLWGIRRVLVRLTGLEVV